MDGGSGHDRRLEIPSLISAEELAHRHTSLWHRETPMLEGLVRAVNSHPRRFTRPLVSDRWTHRRALIAEVAFDEFVRDVEGKRSHRGALKSAQERVGQLTGRSPRSFGTFRETERAEAAELRDRLHAFFKERARGGRLVPRPVFPGCGFVGNAEGDILLGRVLYEVKAANRTFRVGDVRQLLVYSALNSGRPTFEISSVGLVNPLQGTWEEWSLDELSWAIAGRTAADVMRSIVDYMASDLIGPPDPSIT